MCAMAATGLKSDLNRVNPGVLKSWISAPIAENFLYTVVTGQGNRSWDLLQVRWASATRPLPSSKASRAS